GLLNVSQNVVVQENASPLYRHRIFNGLHAMYGLSALSAPLLALGFIAIGWRWGASFALIGMVSVLVGFGFLIRTWSLARREPPVEAQDDSERSFSVWSALFLALALGFYMVGELTL